jgi:phosphoenolpyruvate carboxylase
VIPLIETVDDLTRANEIIEEYLKRYKKEHNVYPSYMRPFIARSDPALNAGLVPAVLASKAAISHYYNLADKYGVPMYPIIGTGSLPFRGSVNPENISEAINEYAGIRTVTLQSAFKYDYPLESVKKAIKFINKTLPTLKPQRLTPKEIAKIKDLNALFSKPYTSSIEKLAPLVNDLARHIPPRRERMLHIGLFGYSRGMGKVSLPRAITFTGVFYSIGVPPEFIGTGRALRIAQQKGHLPFIKRLYVNLARDLTHAGKYLNKENLAMLAKQYPEFANIMTDVQEIENILSIELGPSKPHHFLHRNLVSNIYYKLQTDADISSDLIEAAKVRKSIG